MYVALENVLRGTMIFLTVVALSVLVDCISVLVRILFSQQLSGKFSIYANMILYLESVDRGLALAHII